MKSQYKEIRARVIESLDAKWFVCVTFYGQLNGKRYAARQVMETLGSKAEALTFVKGFDYTYLEVEEGGSPWYEEEGKRQFAFD